MLLLTFSLSARRLLPTEVHEHDPHRLTPLGLVPDDFAQLLLGLLAAGEPEDDLVQFVVGDPVEAYGLILTASSVSV